MLHGDCALGCAGGRIEARERGDVEVRVQSGFRCELANIATFPDSAAWAMEVQRYAFL